MNDRIQDLINGGAGHSLFLDRLMELSAQDLVFLVVPLVLLLWFWPAPEAQRAANQRIAVITAGSIGVALLAGAIAGRLVHEARPFVSDLSTRLLISHAADNSFPSDHATLAFGAAGALLPWKRGLGLAACLLAALIGISRVYVGVHWPSDILGAAAIGLMTGALLAQVEPWLVRPQHLLAGLLPSALVARPAPAEAGES